MKTEILFRFLNVVGVTMLIMTFCVDCRFFYPSVIVLAAVEQAQLFRLYKLFKALEKEKQNIERMFKNEI